MSTLPPMGGYPKQARTYGLAATGIPTEAELEGYVKSKGYPLAVALLERSLQILNDRAENHCDPGVCSISKQDAEEVQRILGILRAKFGQGEAA